MYFIVYICVFCYIKDIIYEKSTEWKASSLLNVLYNKCNEMHFLEFYSDNSRIKFKKVYLVDFITQFIMMHGQYNIKCTECSSHKAALMLNSLVWRNMKVVFRLPTYFRVVDLLC